MPKINVTQDQVLADLKNVILFLTAIDNVMPDIFEQAGIDALQAIADHPALLMLLTTVLQKV
jgi:hypothetical protein